MQPLEPDDPRTIGPYRLLRRLGAGGMGRVYLARSAGGRTVAVKVVHPHFSVDEQFRERFRREVASARRVGTASHGQPGRRGGWTAPVLDADPDARTPWVATGYVAGPSLQQAVTEHGALPQRSVRVLGAGLAAALCHVHGLGLVHRDVKPSNVMLTPEGPRLIDFGIARAIDGTASLTSTGVSIGSPGYMSPEQVLGRGVTYPSDVFSLGAVLAFAARGEAPFRGDGSAVLLYKVVHEEPELGGLEGELRELVASCLAKDADVRPEPAQLVEQLSATGDGGVGGWLPGPIVEQVGRRAVELLDLEPDESGGGSDGPESGPVPFTTPSRGPQETHEPLSLAPSAPSGQGRRPGLAVTARAERSKRQISCSLVLTAACVLAVALFGSYFFHLLPGSGGGGASSDTAQPGATPSSRSSPPGQKSGDVPGAFLGTWKGELTLGGGAPDSTMSVTFEQGERGERVGHGGARPGGVACEGEYSLESAAPGKLKVKSVAPGKPPVCADGERVEFTLGDDGTLAYTSRSAGAEAAEATLRKVE
ncbi:MAG TPA: serine/threonine-protein kinase [Streptomyces sp.]|jgi:serine/threonine protein kinase|nr:serine/threonine-protein kinase [Streptomyces sp.]